MALIHEAKVISATEGTDGLFWIDPWTPGRDGQVYADRMRPIEAQVRLHAEAAMTLIAQARAANPAPTMPISSGSDFPSAPTSLHEANAIDAMELGARRIDFLALKFQLADEMVSGYARAFAASISTDPKLKKTISRELSDINGVNGRMQDILYGYAQLRDLFGQAWMRTNRSYGLRPVLDHYDMEVQLWQGRADKVRAAQRQYSDTKTLPTAAALNIPSS